MVKGGEEHQISALFIVIFVWTCFCYDAFTAFRVLFNVCIINTMRVNEEEVQGVSDALPSTVKAQLKRKRPISEVLENVPACSSIQLERGEKDLQRWKS